MVEEAIFLANFLEFALMRLIAQIRQILIATTLVVVLTFTNAVSVLAQPLSISPSEIQVATTDLGQQAKASAKKVEGKVQETVGNVTGDRETQIEGKVKQAEGDIRAVPSDGFGNPTDKLSETEIEGKTQQAESNIRRFQARDGKATNLKEALQ